MAHIPGFSRSQLLLLPEAVDDYVGPDNPVRFIDAFVDGLDLAEAGFARVRSEATGRPGFTMTGPYLRNYANNGGRVAVVRTGSHAAEPPSSGQEPLLRCAPAPSA
jgi:hypothetical protein